MFCYFNSVLTCYLQFISPGNYALGFFLIACIHCLNITEFGNKNSIQKSPLLIIIFMGFPKTNEKIMEYLSIDIETVFLKLLSTLLLRS